ncbi:hypothetical protein X975_00897, partial [Stegodyphus mimosarum]
MMYIRIFSSISKMDITKISLCIFLGMLYFYFFTEVFSCIRNFQNLSAHQKKKMFGDFCMIIFAHHEIFFSFSSYTSCPETSPGTTVLPSPPSENER